MHVLNYDLRKLRICWRSRIKPTHTRICDSLHCQAQMCDDARFYQGWTDWDVTLLCFSAASFTQSQDSIRFAGAASKPPQTSSSFFTRDVRPDETQMRNTSSEHLTARNPSVRLRFSLLHWCFSAEQRIQNSFEQYSYWSVILCRFTFSPEVMNLFLRSPALNGLFQDQLSITVKTHSDRPHRAETFFLWSAFDDLEQKDRIRVS